MGNLLTFASASPVLIPEDFFREVGRIYKQDRATSDFLVAHADLAFLDALVRIMGFSSAQVKLEVLAREFSRDKIELMKLGNLTFRFVREDGRLLTQDMLSYGQKRLLTFFYYLAANEHVVIADELVNGLHHNWITECVDAIGERQAFLTSQNPLLLDYLPFESAEQVRSTFVICRTEKEGPRSRMAWENMSEEDAAEFFRGYQVGIEHVSEILQSRGLW